MNNNLYNRVLAMISVPVVLFILLLPFSFITGWDSATAVIYWLFITPFVAEYVPTLFSKNKNQLRQSVIGMLFFYSIMIFKSYQTDMFFIMMVSCVINLGSITLISYVKKVYREPSY